MLAFIKSNYKAGDSIEINSSKGVFLGQIEYVNDRFIILRQSNGMLCGIAAQDILSFTAEHPDRQPAEVCPTTNPPAYEVPEEHYISEETADEIKEQQEVLKEELENDPNYMAVRAEKLQEPKVLGRIDLSKIDPKGAQRSFFKKDEAKKKKIQAAQPAPVAMPAPNPMLQQAQQPVQAQPTHAPYVAAKGRVLFYNPERRYGFIQDYNTNQSIYFSVQQVIDPALYEVLQKDTKVVYHLEAKAKGPVAVCIHLPNTFRIIMSLAEDHIDANHLDIAKGLALHILEVAPYNADARALVDDVNNAQAIKQPKATIKKAPVRTAPTMGGFTYKKPETKAPDSNYAKAKQAFIDKRLDEAEDFYLKAINDGDKPDSSVKDMLTLLVARYKKEESPERKQQRLDMAIEFLNKYKNILPDNLTNKQFLALNFYLPIGDYKQFITLVNELMEDPSVKNMPTRYVFYIWQKALATYRMGQVDEALELIEQGLAITPNNRQLTNLKSNIYNPEANPSFSANETGAAAQTAATTE